MEIRPHVKKLDGAMQVLNSSHYNGATLSTIYRAGLEYWITSKNERRLAGLATSQNQAE